MSEEILKALMQLFALLAKQDGGVEEKEEKYVMNFLKTQLGDTDIEFYFGLFREAVGQHPFSPQKEKKRTPVIDSLKILKLCRKINKTLNKSQKVVVLVRLFELVGSNRKLTKQRLSIIDTVSEVFRIRKEEYESIQHFSLGEFIPESSFNPDILCVNSKNGGFEDVNTMRASGSGDLCFLRVPGINVHFVRYAGNDELYLNGLSMHRNRIYLFARGSAIRLPHGKPIYYSDISSYFLNLKPGRELYFEADKVSFRYSGQDFILNEVSFNARHGNLIGIMGSSGNGKTTLLNILSGLYKPVSGKVTLNGYPVDSPEIRGSIGYIPEDDLLIEELTVFENLYFNAQLCFKDLPETEIIEKTDHSLERLGLLPQKNQRVGNAFNKMISGGQRKRLNIALELIREPSVLLVDEPTSGLSSRDSENVMDLIRELTLSGKLIFVVIHQPSSELFKMFDKIILLDEGGQMVYYGNPIESVIHFKKLDDQINPGEGECPLCGNVNPELIFNILEAKVVDEYGNYTRTRKLSALQWKELFQEQREAQVPFPKVEKPQKNLNVPGWLKQTGVFLRRDILSKLGNRQYMALTLLEAPLLGFILSYLIRYIADPGSNTYIFRENENIPVYIFMTMIVAVFLGLTLSAEEIFRDRKILKRERFLNLSRSGYLASKMIILFSISALQAFLFIIIANSVVELRNMNFAYWFAFFTTAACANMIGLNISSAFNSAITIYIVIPLLIIPMMVLSGAMFSFDKLNRTISRVDKVPALAELMPTRWSYEALMVNQFKNNFFQSNFYEYDKNITNADFNLSYYIPELENRLRKVKEELHANPLISDRDNNLLILKNEVLNQGIQVPHIPVPEPEIFDKGSFTVERAEIIEAYLHGLKMYYLEAFTRENKRKSNAVRNRLKNMKDIYYSYLDDFHNESVSDQVRKIYERKKIVEYNHRLVRMSDPVYQDPLPVHPLDFRTHFFAPRKHFLGNYFETYTFNMAVIWILSLFFFITLYFDWLKKIIQFNYRKLFRNIRFFHKNMTDNYS